MSDVTDAATAICGCCGQSRPAAEVARLNCRPEVAVCGGCVDWMASKVQARPKVTPIFPVRDMGEAREFWTRAGVEVEVYDGGYAFVHLGGAELRTCAAPHTRRDRRHVRRSS